MKHKKSIWKDEQGQFTYVILFIIIFAILIFAFAVVIPIMEAFIVGFYSGTQSIEPTINQGIAQITDANLQRDMNAAVQGQKDMQLTTIQLFTTLATYGGIITIIVIFFAWLLIGRRNVEAGGLG